MRVYLRHVLCLHSFSGCVFSIHTVWCTYLSVWTLLHAHMYTYSYVHVPYVCTLLLHNFSVTFRYTWTRPAYVGLCAVSVPVRALWTQSWYVNCLLSTWWQPNLNTAELFSHPVLFWISCFVAVEVIRYDMWLLHENSRSMCTLHVQLYTHRYAYVRYSTKFKDKVTIFCPHTTIWIFIDIIGWTWIVPNRIESPIHECINKFYYLMPIRYLLSLRTVQREIKCYYSFYLRETDRLITTMVQIKPVVIFCCIIHYS